jgi:hypothetical protein
MNRETLAIVMTEYAGIASICLAALISGAFDLVRSRVIPARQWCQVRHLYRGPSHKVSHPAGYAD